MKNSLFIAALLTLLVSTTWAQKKVSPVIRLVEKMPRAWGQAVATVITLTNTDKQVVKSIRVFIQLDKTTTIDISVLEPGAYTLKVQPEDIKDSSAVFTTQVKKQKAQQTIQLTFSTVVEPNFPPNMKKPVIYLYPQQTEEVAINITLKGQLTETIPAYNGGWKVSARPDGTITNCADGKQYPYLFWEGHSTKHDWDMTDGFVVNGKESRTFLEHRLKDMGLLPKEYMAFIDYWTPALEKNEYNLIHFAGKEYEDVAALNIIPKPDAMLRIFMIFKAADKNTKATPQHFNGFMRKGFTVVEWGGMQLDDPMQATVVNHAGLDQ